MRQIVLTALLLVRCISAIAQDVQGVDYEIEGALGEEIELVVSGFADSQKSKLSIEKIAGGEYSCNDAYIADGKLTFVFGSPEEYVFDFWEDYDGCRLNTTVRFWVFAESLLDVPNIFTPNGDGVNDWFHIKYDNRPESFEITIFNRLGKKMYSSSDPDFRWDGYHCSAGVYSYVIVYGNQGRQKTLNGFIMLEN